MANAVFFDAGGTLIWEPPWIDRFAGGAAELGIDLTADARGRVWERVQQEWRPLRPWPRVISLEEEEQEQLRRYTIALEALGVPDPRGEVARQLHERCWWVRHAQPFPETRSTLEAARERARVLGVISNAPPGMHVVLQRLDLARYFDIIVVSDVVGLTKPDPEIYRFALDRAGVATRAGSRPVLAAGSVFVDDLEENVAAAESVGMRGVLIDRQNRLPDAPHPRITNLDQILTFLGAAAGT